MNDATKIECNGETYQKWASDPRYEILSVETPKPGVYRFTPQLKTGCWDGDAICEGTPLHQKQLRAVEADVAQRPASVNLATPTILQDPLFGNTSPANPSGVVNPQELSPTPHVPAGQLSQRIELLPADIADFMLRVRRMEIVITGQMPHADGRRTVFEYVEASKYRPEPKNAPKAILERSVSICEICHGPLEEDGTCNICAVGDRIFSKARQNRRAYHNFKKGLTNA